MNQRFKDSIERIRRIERSRADTIQRPLKSIADRERVFAKALIEEIVPVKISIEWPFKIKMDPIRPTEPNKPDNYDDYIDHA